MTPEESKRRQKLDAATRAAAATATNTESQVTKAAPQVYRAPRINVPANRHEFAKLIEAELTKIEQAQTAIVSLMNERPNGYKYIKGTIVIRTAADKSFGLQLEQADAAQANYIRFWGSLDAGYQGGVGVPDASNSVAIWSDIGATLCCQSNGFVSHSGKKLYFTDGGQAQQLTGLAQLGDPFVSLLPYALRTDGGGNQFGTDANTAPINASIFMYAGTYNGIGLNGVLSTYGTLNGGYQHQTMMPYSGYVSGCQYARWRNGDDGTWGAWRAGHAHYAGNTAYIDYNGISYINDPGSVRANGYMEVRQYDDGNGIGNASPGGGYGTFLSWVGGSFATQMVTNDTTGSITIRTSYSGNNAAWHRHDANTMVRRDVYTELLEIGVITEAQHSALVARMEVTEARKLAEEAATAAARVVPAVGPM
ncbi:hypothetical protein [Buttiauxella sp. A111]|uniref:hypothetical protein n=1 Tax=Buttiauxella sp. A111 TaxID=2563088 RepID=UPI0010CFD437|nr:hypothetical protein [Buttiauxella sp. A111]GDX06336.1 hypothetical protein BSPA111_25450 [Buttiauxella sp. A111]